MQSSNLIFFLIFVFLKPGYATKYSWNEMYIYTWCITGVLVKKWGSNMSYLPERKWTIPASSDIYLDFVLHTILLCLVGFLKQELARKGSICSLAFSQVTDLLWSMTPAFQKSLLFLAGDFSFCSCRRMWLLRLMLYNLVDLTKPQKLEFYSL